MFTLAIFVNFTVLPSLAVICDWDISTLNNNISEEEVKNNIANFNEKFPPSPYKVNDYIQQRIISKGKKTNFAQFSNKKMIHFYLHLDQNEFGKKSIQIPNQFSNKRTL